MRTMALLCCLAAAAVYGSAQDRVTVDQLEQRLAAAHGRSDKDLAHRLEDLQLTQRLSTARLAKLEAALPGAESRAALMAVADLSAVLDLPAGEVPGDPPPTAAEQQQMLARAYAAADAADDQMPDFNATANVTRYRNLKFLTSESTPVPLIVPVPLVFRRDTDVATRREGRVFTTHTSLTGAPDDAVKAGVESWEGLYAVLANVLVDMRGSQPAWVRWEQGPTGVLAVFRYAADKDHAHFPITVSGYFRYANKDRAHFPIAAGKGYSPKSESSDQPGYHGEVALDPATGVVQRFVLQAILDPGQHVSRADAVVDFGPVNVDGKSFLGPLRAVTISVTQSLVGYYNSNNGNNEFRVSEDIRPLTQIIDVEFEDYRRSESKPPAAANPAFVAAAIQAKGERLTVEQLEKVVEDLGGKDSAERLAKIELTQRLTAERYARMRDQLQGKALAGGALLALYDLSAFADLPPADLADGAAPDAGEQGKMVTRAVEFVAGVTHKMPDLFATRDLARFEDLHVVRAVPELSTTEVKPLALVDQSTGSVHFREGREVVETGATVPHAAPRPMGLDTWGTFGPILEIVMADMLQAKIGWGHWEHGPTGRLAVFRYAVPQAASHYDVRFCCYWGQDGLPSSFSARPGYHGELAIDPGSGAILRLVLKADLRPDVAAHVEPDPAAHVEPDPAAHGEQEKSPLLRSDVLVEYGAVDIGGKQYVCPTRSVSVMTSWTLGSQGPIKQWVEDKKAAKKALALMEFSRVNAINEAVFRDYHVFRTEMRIVAQPAEAGPAGAKP